MWIFDKMLYWKYHNYTMIPEKTFIKNLELCRKFTNVHGDIVECGVWRGGMAAAMAEVVGDGKCVHLFDSFEGLPPARPIDGVAALQWQKDTVSPGYYNNCTAGRHWAVYAMRLSGHKKFTINKGWFQDTLDKYNQPISILRIDCDWYSSVMSCFNNLYNLVSVGGLIIIDDYYVWDGCVKAIHQFDPSIRIRQYKDDVAYIIKQK